MEKKILFPQIGGIMHGGDYNPEQWLDRPDILEEDIRMMKKAGMNCATLGVFSWSTYEPREGEFHFAWLHDIMDKLYANGIYTILATPGLTSYGEGANSDPKTGPKIDSKYYS